MSHGYTVGGNIYDFHDITRETLPECRSRPSLAEKAPKVAAALSRHLGTSPFDLDLRCCIVPEHLQGFARLRAEKIARSEGCPSWRLTCWLRTTPSAAADETTCVACPMFMLIKQERVNAAWISELHIHVPLS